MRNPFQGKRKGEACMNEPWKIIPQVYNCRNFSIVNAKGQIIADLLWWGEDSRQEENARRIVACVNAYEGISTKDLESEQERILLSYILCKDVNLQMIKDGRVDLLVPF